MIGVVVTSLEEAHKIESRRGDQLRREAAATDDPADDRRVKLVQQLQDLRRALEAVEHDIEALDEPAI